MLVEMGLFQGDNLLTKGMIKVAEQEQMEKNDVMELKYQLVGEAAELKLRVFGNGEQLIKSSLTMPVHESDDWESIELGGFTLAFRCRLNA